MLDHVRLNFEECKAILRHHIVLDPDFILFCEFFSRKKNVSHRPPDQWLKSEDIPLTIVSSGMEPLIRVCLEKLLGEEEAARIEIVANNVDFVPVSSAEQQCQTRDDGLRWQIQFRHPLSPLGHDKSEAILRHRQLPAPSGQTNEASAEEEVKTFIFFSGDGVSDLSAARHADILFAKKDYHLQTYCEREKLPYIPWTTFADILASTKEIVQKHKEGANQT